MAANVAVVGIDVGNQSCVIGQAKRGGIDVILNENSKRLTRYVTIGVAAVYNGEGTCTLFTFAW